MSAYRGADRRVEAVGRDHQVVRRGELLDAGSLGAEVHGHVERRAPRLQDLQQPTPAHRREAVPTAGDHLALEVHVDVVPDRELALHRRVDRGVRVLDAAERLVAEHDPEAERVVGRVALPHGDLVLPSPRCAASCWARALKYRPPGPPPITAIRMLASASPAVYDDRQASTSRIAI